MKPPTGNKKPLFALAAAVVLILAFSLVYLPGLKKKGTARKIVDAEIEGVNLTYLTFNKNNEKKLEVKCEESQKKDDDRLLMKKITATIFKADKLDGDIRISADSGYAQYDFHDFFLQGNAVISSASFSLSSKSFFLKSLDVLSTKDAVAFRLRDVTGRARSGMLYVIQDNVLRLLEPKGVMVRSNQRYEFQAKIIRVNERKKWLLLQQKASVKGTGSLIRGERIVLQFDPDFANLETTAASGKCYFQTVDTGESGQRQSKEITANQIKMLNDEQGRLQRIAISGDGKIALVDDRNQGQIQSDSIEISLRSETQTLETIRALARGTLRSRGKDNLTVSGDSFLAVYDKDGSLAAVHADKKCSFRFEDLTGNADKIHYDLPGFKIDITGKNTSVNSKKNVFDSSQFIIQTKLKKLSSDKGVRATLIPEKKNVLLRSRPVFVTAAGMELSEQGNVTRFKGKVQLFQDEIELQAGELLFETPENRISCRGNADLKFMAGDEQVILHGKTLVFHAGELKIVLEGDARLQQGENVLTARKIELTFDREDRLEDITAANQVTFSKKDLSGKAQSLHWYYTKKTVLFRDDAEITKKASGTTRGQELLFDLSSNEISVSSSEDRSETVIKQETP